MTPLEQINAIRDRMRADYGTPTAPAEPNTEDRQLLSQILTQLQRSAPAPDLATRVQDQRASIAAKSQQLRDRMRERDAGKVRTIVGPDGTATPRRAVIASIGARDERRARNEQANAWAEQRRAEQARGMERHTGDDL